MEKSTLTDVKVETRAHEPCDGLDYVNIGVVAFGDEDEACAYGICAALYDLSVYYETESSGYISSVDNEFLNLDGDFDLPHEDDGVPPKKTLTDGIGSTTIQVLTNESYLNYLSYIKRLEENIVNDPDNAEYWKIFIDCYKGQITTKLTDKQPFSP